MRPPASDMPGDQYMPGSRCFNASCTRIRRCRYVTRSPGARRPAAPLLGTSEHAVEVVRTADVCDGDRHAERGGPLFRAPRARSGESGPPQTATRGPRNDLLEQLDVLLSELGYQMGETGDVSARSPEARHQPLSDRIRHEPHDNRDRGGCLHGGGRAALPAGHDDVDLCIDEIGDQSRQTIRLAIRKRWS